MPSQTQVTFMEAVAVEFAFLKEYGFTFDRITEFDALATSPVVSIELQLDWDRVVGAFLPRRELVPPEAGGASGVAIKTIAAYVSEQPLPIKPRRTDALSPADVKEDLAALAQMVKKYCTPLLRGNYSIWPPQRFMDELEHKYWGKKDQR